MKNTDPIYRLEAEDMLSTVIGSLRTSGFSISLIEQV